MTSTSTSYVLRSGRAHAVKGPLALLAGQAAQAAAAGREAHISDQRGVTVAVIANPTAVGFAVISVGPLELFPQTETTNPPAWTTRLADLINQLGETP